MRFRSSNFWHHKVRNGREQAYAKLKTSGGGIKHIIENIEYADLSQNAYAVITHPTARNELRNFLKLQLDD